ncbi:MAG: DUF4865 family protein [Rickettsiales bacterium]
MQYSIHLPPNYDSELITQRVAARRGLFDTHKGLVHKSFLFNASERIYAPFYIWKDAGEARNFLMDELFHGVVETFNRHRVRSWYVLSAVDGNQNVVPGYACREIDVIPQEGKLEDYLEHEKAEQAKLADNPDLYRHVLALDADRWEILQFSLWKDKASAIRSGGDCVVDYDVLHVSEPTDPELIKL